MLERINRLIARRPNVVHAGEGSASTWRSLFERSLHTCGVSPPYWRFVPRYLAWPPIRALRERHPFVGDVGP